MQPESMEPHQSIQSRQSSSQTDTSLVRSSCFPLQNSTGFVAQQQSVAGKGNSQGGRRRGDFSKPSLRGPPQKYSRSKKDGKPKGQAAPGRSVQVYHEVAQDREVELELSLARGRKVSLNHLLNFTFQSRGDQVPSRGRNRFPIQSSHHYIKPAKYNKDQFLQANCQFIVKHEADYSVYLADPDLLVDWTLIEQIRLRGPEVGSCPICLHPPIAAKMTRCGHIYCWPCVLHYLALSDRAWRGCPVCADPIYRKDLKSVISIPQCQYKIGEQIEFRLMCREKESLMPHFVSQPPAEELGQMSNERGQKLVLATPQEVAEFILRREKVELETQYECDKDEPEACFILEALTLLRDRENQQTSSYEDGDPSAEISLQDIGKLELDDSLLAEEQELDELNDRMRYTSVSSDPSGDLSKDEISGTGTVSSIGPEDLEFHETEIPKSNESEISITPKRDVHYFYQAVDGQHIYLHSVNAQMLIHEYGSLEKAPRILHGRIIERDTMNMTHELKNRLRYLRHLPVTTIFEVIEIDLGVPVISKATFDRFRDRLVEREHRRRRKDREEKRRERRIQIEEEAKLGRYPKLNVKIDSSLHFPYCSRDDYQPGDEPGPSLVPECQQEIEVSSAHESVWGGASSSSGPSFAQTLREGKLKPSPSWPVVQRSVTTPQPRSKAWESEDEEPPGFGIEYQPPEAMSLSAALSAALDKAVLEGSKGPAESSSTSRKKKNKSKKLLFSTGF